MKALLKTYHQDSLAHLDVVELPDNYDGDQYGDTVPFSVGSNQSLVPLEDGEKPVWHLKFVLRSTCKELKETYEADTREDAYNMLEDDYPDDVSWVMVDYESY